MGWLLILGISRNRLDFVVDLSEEKATFGLVSEPVQRFLGAKPYTLDAKNRIAVQPGWRPAGEMALYLLTSMTHDMPMLKVITQAGYDERMANIADSTELSVKEKWEMEGILAANCRDVSISDQNKLTIPKDLCDYANLKPDTDVFQVGRHRHFEIWNIEYYNRAKEIERAKLNDNKIGIL
jgi:DNA-binding transcriptional regulator/RsmH inhibitor MraZ